MSLKPPNEPTDNFVTAGLTGPTGARGPTGPAGGVPLGWFDITAEEYGAVGDGTTDDTAAIQAAIDDCLVDGGVVWVPNGTYVITSPLQVHNNQKTIRIMGANAGWGHINIGDSVIKCTEGAGHGPMLELYSIHGVEVDHLHFLYTDATYDGDIIDIDGDNVAGGDCLNFELHNLSFRGNSSNNNLTSARSNIRLHKAIIGHIHDCQFEGAENVVRIGDPGGSYVVGVTFDNFTCNHSADTAHFLIGTADGENITIRNGIFEAGTDTGAVRGATTALDGGNCQLYSFEFSNNWMGDASGAANWVSGLQAQSKSPLVFINNFFGDTSGVHISVDSTVTLTAIGNRFAGSTVFDAAVEAEMVSSIYVVVGNSFQNVAELFGTTDRPQQLTMIGNANGYGSNAASDERTAFDTLPARVALGAGKGVGTSGVAGISLTNPVSPSNDYEQLVLGCHNQNALVAHGPKAAVYTQVVAGSVGTVGLNLQAGSDDDDSWVRLVAGATPSEVLKVDKSGAVTRMSVHGVTPAARPTAYTQTYATATRTHAAATADAVSETGATQTTPWGYASEAQANAITTEINDLRDDLLNAKQVLNSVIDDLQAYGFLQ